MPSLVESIMKYDIGRPVRYYMKEIARNPLIMSLLQAPLGYLAGKYVGLPALEYFSPAVTEETRKRRQRYLPLMGAAAGLIPPALIALGRYSGPRERSYLQSLEQELGAGQPLGIAHRRADLERAGPTFGEALTKRFSEKRSAFFGHYVPTQPGTQNLILMDPVLSPYEKAVAISAVNQAQHQSDNRVGLVTTGDLMRGAIGAGLGYLGAKLFGKLLGIGFDLSPGAQRNIGRAGIIGGILGNTGVLRVGR